MEALNQSILSSRSIQNLSNSMWICHCRYCQKLTRQFRCRWLTSRIEYLFTCAVSFSYTWRKRSGCQGITSAALLHAAWAIVLAAAWFQCGRLERPRQVHCRPRPATRIGKMWSLAWCCQGGMSQFKELKAGDEAFHDFTGPHWNLPGMVGLLICTLPLRVQISQNASCLGLALFQCFFRLSLLVVYSL